MGNGGIFVSPCSTFSSNTASQFHHQHNYPRQELKSDDGIPSNLTTTGYSVRLLGPTAASGQPVTNQQAIKSQYSDVTYTNAANLQHTIALQ